jgi:hypothetical protein
MSRDIRRRPIDDSGSKDNLQEQIDAAFEVYWQGYIEKHRPAFESELLPDIVKAKVQEEVKKTFASGFSAAYASYIVGMHALRKS